MKRYSEELIQKAKNLRRQGETYSEIIMTLNTKIPKSTLNFWCKDIPLPKGYQQKIVKLSRSNLNKARAVAFEVRRKNRVKSLKEIEKRNIPISSKIADKDIAKIALAMLCLGEASKSGHKTGFNLGNSSPVIITLFLELLRHCCDFDVSKVRCTVQCRADQEVQELEKYWQKITGIPADQFYKAQVDPRTMGKPTRNPDYRGVLRVDYQNSKTRLELESLSSLIYNIVSQWAVSSPGRAQLWHS